MNNYQIENELINEANALAEKAESLGKEIFIRFKRAGDPDNLAPYILFDNKRPSGFWDLKPAIEEMRIRVKALKS